MRKHFGFALVPFKTDGLMEKLYKNGSCYEGKKKGFEFLTTLGDEVILRGDFDPNMCLSDKLNKMTQGVFRKMIGSGGEQRYILLEPRIHHLCRLREILHSLPTNRWPVKFVQLLTILLENAFFCIAVHRSRAALIIY